MSSTSNWRPILLDGMSRLASGGPGGASTQPEMMPMGEDRDLDDARNTWAFTITGAGLGGTADVVPGPGSNSAIIRVEFNTGTGAITLLVERTLESRIQIAGVEQFIMMCHRIFDQIDFFDGTIVNLDTVKVRFGADGSNFFELAAVDLDDIVKTQDGSTTLAPRSVFQDVLMRASQGAGATGAPDIDDISYIAFFFEGTKPQSTIITGPLEPIFEIRGLDGAFPDADLTRGRAGFFIADQVSRALTGAFGAAFLFGYTPKLIELRHDGTVGAQTIEVSWDGTTVAYKVLPFMIKDFTVVTDRIFLRGVGGGAAPTYHLAVE